MKHTCLMRLSVVTLTALFIFTGCSGGGGGGASAQIPSIMSTGSDEASKMNNEGVDHLVQGHYAVAKDFFDKAIAANPNLAEAHFNLGVSLDGDGKHPEATESFKKAAQLGSSNSKITGSDLLKKHTGM